jgi:alanyl-tRNA synthetase
MRSISFSISDGLLPSRNGLGGFLKYLILKSLKVCHETFKVDDGSQLMCELVPEVILSFHGAYPDIANKSEYIQKVIRQTNKRQAEKFKHSQQVIERFVKKLNSPSHLGGDQIWKLFKGDGRGEEIPIEFISEYCAAKQMTLDLEAYDKLYLAENENALKTLKNYRKDNSKFIELASQLKQRSVQSTDNSGRYEFDLDEIGMLASYKANTGWFIYRMGIFYQLTFYLNHRWKIS